MSEGRGEVYAGFWWGNLRERERLGDPGMDVMVELQLVGWGGMDWIDQVQDRDRWRTLVNMVMHFRVP